MIDTHAHLNFKAFKNILRETILKANRSGVKKIIVPGANLDSSIKAVEIAYEYNNIYAAVGIHPLHANESLKEEINSLKEKLNILAQNKKVVAIGECGLDYLQIENSKFKIQNDNEKIKIKKIQKKIFAMQIDLAYELHLPLIIHNREASDDILKILHLKSYILDQISGVFHCFQGNFELLNWALNHHFYIGITGLVTYDKYMQSVVEKTPLENILIETDSPYLRPRLPNLSLNFPNTPVNVKIVAKTIAFIKKKSIEEVINKTTQNANSLFLLD